MIQNAMIRYSLIFKILTVTALATVLIMSLRPSVDLGSIPQTDKLVHFLAYGVLAGLVRLGWPKVWGGTIFLSLAIFGIGIELAQNFMAVGRHGSVADTLANLLGAALVLFLFHIFWTRHRR